MKIVLFDAERKSFVIDADILLSRKDRIGLGKERFLDYYNHRWHFSRQGKNLGTFQDWEIVNESEELLDMWD